jgi:hypothetical protein
MKKLILFFSILVISLTTNAQQSINVDTIYNTSKIQQIDGRDVTFGVKETVEEIALDKNISKHIVVEITKIESPQQMINIVGIQWLKKNYEVEVLLTIEGDRYIGKAVRKTFLFAALLNVEGGEVPLNRKSFSKALQKSLEDAFNNL